MDTDIVGLLEVNNQLSNLLTFFGEYSGLGVFVATLMVGEAAIFFSFLLTQQEILSFGEVFIFSFLAVLLTDLFWFLIGRYFPKKYIPVFANRSVLLPVSTVIEKVVGDRILVSMVLFKFFIGLRIAYMLYLSQQKIRIRDLIVYDIIATFLFVLVLGSAGLLLGRYIQEVFFYYQYVAILTVGLLFFLTIFLFTKLLFKKSATL